MGDMCNQCGYDLWKICTDGSKTNYTDGRVLYAECENCGNKVSSRRKASGSYRTYGKTNL